MPYPNREQATQQIIDMYILCVSVEPGRHSQAWSGLTLASQLDTTVLEHARYTPGIKTHPQCNDSKL